MKLECIINIDLYRDDFLDQSYSKFCDDSVSRISREIVAPTYRFVINNIRVKLIEDVEDILYEARKIYFK